jgi:hypothetical protein
MFRHSSRWQRSRSLDGNGSPPVISLHCCCAWTVICPVGPHRQSLLQQRPRRGLFPFPSRLSLNNSLNQKRFRARKTLKLFKSNFFAPSNFTTTSCSVTLARNPWVWPTAGVGRFWLRVLETKTVLSSWSAMSLASLVVVPKTKFV